MKFTTVIDNITAQKWGLSIQEAYLFDWLFSLPSWANKAVIESEVFYFASKNKAVDELPMLTDKPDTMYRYYKGLELKELIVLSKIGGKDYILLTDKAKQWNGNKSERSENNPNNGKIIREKLGNKSESNSENNPTYNNTKIDYNINTINKEESEFSKNENYALSKKVIDFEKMIKEKDLEIQSLKENQESPTKKVRLPKRTLSEMCRDFLNNNPEKYSSIMYTEFFDYWSEQGEGQLKQRWQYQKTFDVSKRLERWQKKGIEINQSKQNGSTSQVSNSRSKNNWNPEQVALEALAISKARFAEQG